MTFAETPRPVASAALDRIIEDYGVRRVLVALFWRQARKLRPPAAAGAEVPDYLRRDLGLPERPQAPLLLLRGARPALPPPRLVPEALGWDLGRTDLLPTQARGWAGAPD